MNTVFQITRDAGRHMLSSRGGVAGEAVPEGGAAGNPRGNGKIINISSLVAYQGMSARPSQSPNGSPVLIPQVVLTSSRTLLRSMVYREWSSHSRTAGPARVSA